MSSDLYFFIIFEFVLPMVGYIIYAHRIHKPVLYVLKYVIKDFISCFSQHPRRRRKHVIKQSRKVVDKR